MIGGFLLLLNMTIALLEIDYFTYYVGPPPILEALSLVFLIIVVSRYIFRVKFEKSILSKKELKNKPLYKPKDILLQENPQTFYNHDSTEDFSSTLVQSIWTRVVIIGIAIYFVFLPLQTILEKDYYYFWW